MIVGAKNTVSVATLDVTAPDVIRHAVAPPDVAGPYDSEPYDMGVTGRDLRIVDGAYTGDPDAPVGPPVLDAWVRFAALPAITAFTAVKARPSTVKPDVNTCATNRVANAIT